MQAAARAGLAAAASPRVGPRLAPRPPAALAASPPLRRGAGRRAARTAAGGSPCAAAPRPRWRAARAARAASAASAAGRAGAAAGGASAAARLLRPDVLARLRRAVARLREDPSLLGRPELAPVREWAEEARAGAGSREPPPPLPDGLKVFIATPAFGGNVTVEYMASVLGLITQLPRVTWQLHLTAGESILQVGRNNAVMEFLSTDATHLLFLDADVGFEAETVWGLLAEDRDVALAMYPSKSFNEGKMAEAASRRGGSPRLADGLEFRFRADPQRLREAALSGARFVEVEAGPAGCMLIRRNVFDELRAAYPDMHCKISGSHAGRSVHREVWWQFFDTMVTSDSEFLTEDIAFCRRWRAIGGSIWADIGARMAHVGRHAFRARMCDSVASGTP